MARRKAGGAELRVSLRVDTGKFERDMAGLSDVVQKRLVKAALLAGGDVIRKTAVSRAPGPSVVVQAMSAGRLVKGVNTREMKKAISSTGLYVVVGPDREHWYYRFSEYGTKTHRVTKRKRTVRAQALKRGGMRLRDVRKVTGKTRPVMSWMDGGRRVFALKVRGFAAKPFMEPAAASAGGAAVAEVGKVLAREIKSYGKH